MIHGLLMALADSVPGVSGGTVAFIMGFYERLLDAIHGLFGKDPVLRKDAFFYLMKFAVGWCLGMGASILLLSHIFETNIYFLSSLFLGLTISAIPFIIYEERNHIKGKYKNLIFTVLGAAFVISLTALRANYVGIGAVDFENLTFLQYGYLFLSGMLAVCAMLLPGISGSTLLLILGIYVPAISAVKEILHLHIQYFPGVLLLAAGALAGAVLASGFIGKALDKFRSQMIFLILGLMFGSLYAILMGPTTLDVPKPPVDLSSFHIVAFLSGVAILAGLEYIKKLTVPVSNQSEDQL